MERLGAQLREETWKQMTRSLSLASMIRGMVDGGGVVAGTPAYEICARVADDYRFTHDPNRPRLPWACFVPRSWTRDQTVASSSGGGFLVDQRVGDTSPFARAFRLARLGAQVIVGLRSNTTFPRVSTSSAFGWLTNEASTVTESDQVFGALAAAPKQGGVVTTYSRQLDLQSTAVEDVLRADLMGEVGRGVDTAAVAGDGTAGAPTGLLTLSGVGSESGTSLAWSGVLDMQKKAADANVDETADAWLGATDVRKLLAAREKVAGNGGFIWSDNRMAGSPALASSIMPAGSLIVGDWSRVVLLFWGPGPTIEINPFDPTGFKVGKISMRVLVSCDVLVRQPSCFVKSTSIT
jgi:HK97 family phage major capsid protein